MHETLNFVSKIERVTRWGGRIAGEHVSCVIILLFSAPRHLPPRRNIVGGYLMTTGA
jgi:hypothetical protein